MLDESGESFKITPRQVKELPPVYEGYKPSDLPTVDEIWKEVLKKEVPNGRSKHGHAPLTNQQLLRLIDETLVEANDIEQAARNPDRWNISQEEAKRTKLIVDFSAPGTYYRSRKEDRYKDKVWSSLMDRERADASAILGIHIAGIATGRDFSEFTKERVLTGLDPRLNARREEVRRAIKEAGLHFVYLGTPQEGEAISKVINSVTSFIPPEAVTVIDWNIDNTLDQIKLLGQFLKDHQQSETNPNGFLIPNSKIDFVLGQQALRVFRMCKIFNAIPSVLQAQLFPIATPENGLKEYPKEEIKGLVYYSLTQEASPTPVQYNLMGRK